MEFVAWYGAISPCPALPTDKFDWTKFRAKKEREKIPRSPKIPQDPNSLVLAC